MRSAPANPRGIFIPQEHVEAYVANGWTVVDDINPHQVLILPPEVIHGGGEKNGVPPNHKKKPADGVASTTGKSIDDGVWNRRDHRSAQAR